MKRSRTQRFMRKKKIQKTPTSKQKTTTKNKGGGRGELRGEKLKLHTLH